MREAVERDTIFMWGTLSVPLATTGCGYTLTPWAAQRLPLWRFPDSLFQCFYSWRRQPMARLEWKPRPTGRLEPQWGSHSSSHHCQISRGRPELPHCTNISAPVCQHLQSSRENELPHKQQEQKQRQNNSLYWSASINKAVESYARQQSCGISLK